MNRYNFQTDVLVYGRAVWELVVVGSLSHGIQQQSLFFHQCLNLLPCKREKALIFAVT